MHWSGTRSGSSFLPLQMMNGAETVNVELFPVMDSLMATGTNEDTLAAGVRIDSGLARSIGFVVEILAMARMKNRRYAIP